MQEFFGAKNQLNFMVNYACFYSREHIQKIWLNAWFYFDAKHILP